MSNNPSNQELRNHDHKQALFEATRGYVVQVHETPSEDAQGMAEEQHWRSRALEKQAQILSTVPPEYKHSTISHSLTDTESVLHIPEQYLSVEELAITTLDATSVVAAVASGLYSSVQVLKAFVHRAVIGHQLLNCCLEFPYDSALAKAEKLDESFKASGGKVVGPMHGLPISVKDQCRVIGTETTCGFIANLGKKDEEDSLLVEILQNAGAVIFVKTNLSIGCMWGETINKLVKSVIGKSAY